MIAVAILLLPSLIISLVNGEEAYKAILSTMIISLVAGTLLVTLRQSSTRIRARRLF